MLLAKMFEGATKYTVLTIRKFQLWCISSPSIHNFLSRTTNAWAHISTIPVQK